MPGWSTVPTIFSYIICNDWAPERSSRVKFVLTVNSFSKVNSVVRFDVYVFIKDYQYSWLAYYNSIPDTTQNMNAYCNFYEILIWILFLSSLKTRVQGAKKSWLNFVHNEFLFFEYWVWTPPSQAHGRAVVWNMTTEKSVQIWSN